MLDTEIKDKDSNNKLNDDLITNGKLDEKDLFGTNIFDDFSDDKSLIEETKKAKEELQKDLYYYLSLTSKIFQVLFVILLILSILGYIYIYIQKNPLIKDNSFLDPICLMIKKSETPLPDSTLNCSSITYIKNYYEEELDTIKVEQAKAILGNLILLYEKEYLFKSKDVMFLKNESKNRLQIIDVLEKFDTLKKEYLGVEKNKIQCGKMEIDSINKIFQINCDAYSQSFENNGIIGFGGDISKKNEYVSGTSISIANSFINYIEKNSTDFTVIEKQKLFEAEPILGDSEIGKTTGYTKKTPFIIKLKINF